MHDAAQHKPSDGRGALRQNRTGTRYPGLPMSPPPESVLAVLPLQIGTTATWSAGRAAAALFPGLAVIGAGVAIVATVHTVKLGLAVVVPGALLVAYALGHVLGAVRNRASDVMLL